MIPAWAAVGVVVVALLVGVLVGLLVKQNACYTRGVLHGQEQAELTHSGWRPAVSGDALGAHTARLVAPDAWADRNRQEAPRIVGYHRPL